MPQTRKIALPHEKPGSCFSCQNRDRADWCVLEQEDLQLLNKIRICNTYQPGQVIFYQGNPCLGLYCVESGTVAIRKQDPQGNEVLLRLVLPGQALGYRTYFANEKYSASAVSVDACNICFIDRAAVRTLLDRNPALGLRFLKRMADDLRGAEENFLQSAYFPVRTRLAHLLLTLKDAYGSVDGAGTWSIRLPILKQDVAAMLGARPETLSRALRELDKDGVATFTDQTVTVPNLDLLLDEMEFADH